MCIDTNKIIIYGGATGSGGLASDDLFHLDLKDGVGLWNTINVGHKTPGKRYGHTLSYSKPFLIVFGGNVGERSVNDCWIINIHKSPIQWSEVICEGGELPCARVYHSAALCTSGSATGMLVIFGGRAIDNNPLGDSWGLRRHRSGHWDWVRAPEKTSPAIRYQHSTLFIGSLMIVIGGRNNNINQELPLEVFDTETSEWSTFKNIERFRHGSWVYEKNIMIYGGFELSNPQIPTDTIMKINLAQLFQGHSSLLSKLQTYSKIEVEERESRSQSPISPNLGKSNGPKSLVREEIPKEKSPRAVKKRKFIMHEPIIGNEKLKGNYDIRKPLTSKQEIPHFFLSVLIQPNTFMNSDALTTTFKPEHIIALCNMAEDIIRKQPMILQPKTPLKIFGDIHGQFSDLMSFFALYGTPHENGKIKDI